MLDSICLLRIESQSSSSAARGNWCWYRRSSLPENHGRSLLNPRLVALLRHRLLQQQPEGSAMRGKGLVPTLIALATTPPTPQLAAHVVVPGSLRKSSDGW